MQAIVIVAGFVVILALLLYFLYQEKEVEEEIKSVRSEKLLTESEVVKAGDWDKKVMKMREEETPGKKEGIPHTPASEQPEFDEEEEEMNKLEEIKGIGPTYQKLLRTAGISSVSSLASKKADELLDLLTEINEREEISKRPPVLENVEDWIEEAKKKIS